MLLSVNCTLRAQNADMDYNVVVVGAGMMGSAAAKYIKSQNEALHVCLIGPDEPQVATIRSNKMCKTKC